MNQADIDQIRAFVTPQRRVEWWALLNVFARPAEMGDLSEWSVFHWLAQNISEADRLAFWNGAFRCGLERRKFVEPRCG